MLNGIIITSLGNVARVQVDGLKDMQRIVGGLIQPVYLSKWNAEVYVNEEGKIYSLPTNDAATSLAIPGVDLFEGDYLAGDVLILGTIDDEGEATDIPVELAKFLLTPEVRI